MHFEELSKRHQTFLSEYVQNGFNATKAYKDVYDPANDNVAAACSSRLLSKDKIQKALEERVQNITPEWVLSEIQSVGKEATRPSDKLRALELLGKYHALFKDTSQNLNLQGLLTADDLETIRKKLPSKQPTAQVQAPKEFTLLPEAETGAQTAS